MVLGGPFPTQIQYPPNCALLCILGNWPLRIAWLWFSWFQLISIGGPISDGGGRGSKLFFLSASVWSFLCSPLWDFSWMALLPWLQPQMAALSFFPLTCKSLGASLFSLFSLTFWDTSLLYFFFVFLVCLPLLAQIGFQSLTLSYM